MQRLVASSNEESDDEVNISDIPGGSSAFEICAKFCYGMIVTLNAYNVLAARCAAEYLEMFETIDKGNLIYKIDVFLTSSIFRTWKDSIIVLQSTKSLLDKLKDLKDSKKPLDNMEKNLSGPHFKHPKPSKPSRRLGTISPASVPHSTCQGFLPREKKARVLEYWSGLANR